MLGHTRHWPPKTPETSVPVADVLKISCQSAGYFSGNYANVTFMRDDMESGANGFIFGRGINMIVIEPFQGTLA
jgi:hypothetical protein